MLPPTQLGVLSNGEGAYFWRILAGVHPCRHMTSRAPGRSFVNCGKCRKRASARIFAIFGEILMGISPLLECFKTIPDTLREEYIRNKSVRCVIACKGAYFW